MKKLKTDKKLTLTTETLTALTPDQTKDVNGGAAPPQLTLERTQYLCTCNCPVG